MSTFWIVLLTILLTVGIQKALHEVSCIVQNGAIKSLSTLCKEALGEDCFTVQITIGIKSYFVVQLSESKKYIIFTNEVVAQMPKDYASKIEYVRRLPLSEKL